MPHSLDMVRSWAKRRPVIEVDRNPPGQRLLLYRGQTRAVVYPVAPIHQRITRQTVLQQQPVVQPARPSQNVHALPSQVQVA